MQKVFKLYDICQDKQFANKIIARYSEANKNSFTIDIPRWMYINEFENDEWINWWDEIYQKYNVIPGETITILL